MVTEAEVGGRLLGRKIPRAAEAGREIRLRAHAHSDLLLQARRPLGRTPMPEIKACPPFSRRRFGQLASALADRVMKASQSTFAGAAIASGSRIFISCAACVSFLSS